MGARTAERTDFLAGVLITAVEGGIDYWAHIKDWQVTEDPKGNCTWARAIIVDDDKHRVARGVGLGEVAKGIGIIKRGDTPIRQDIKDAVALADNENDASYVDVEIADCIVQAGLYGEILYS